MASATTHSPSPTETAQTKPRPSPEKFLRKHRSTCTIVFFFLFFLITPWVFVVVLNFRPIGDEIHQTTYGGMVNSWDDVSGNINGVMVSTSNGLARASKVFFLVCAVLTYPVLSMVLDHAAVATVQRHRPEQRLNAAQLLSLADSPWSRLPSSFKTSGPRTSYSWYAIGLIALGFIQLILQSALVTWDKVRVATNCDVPNAFDCHDGHQSYGIAGYDSTPVRMRQVPAALVTQEVRARMSTDSAYAPQLRVWYDETPNATSFTSSLPAGFHTGVLRYHAMRLNSSVQCQSIPRTSFPDACSGPKPFYGNLSLPSREEEDDAASGQPDISMRWCVPGNYTTSPWSGSRDREDISEDIFIDVFVPDGAYDEGESVQSFTTHCSANTTRGYFELPNFHNDLTHGPLLNNFTIHDRYSTTYNDIPYDEILHTLPYMSNYPYSTSDQLAPGPLTTTMLSMFGNESWILPLQGITNNTSTATLNTIYRDMCIGGIPFINWDYERGFAAAGSGCVVPDGGVSEPLIQIKKHVYTWFSYFGDTDGVSGTLSSATNFANEATLTRSSPSTRDVDTAGVIYSSPGAEVLKPSIPLPAIIIISILIGIETLAILGLVNYTRRRPTFTTRLDAFVVAAIGAQLWGADVEMADLREPRDNLCEKLERHDGVLGLNHGSLTYAGAGRSAPSARPEEMVPTAGNDSYGPREIVVGGVCSL
ncbi:hypothetical protein F5Y08DRAFT_318349, partial [Xylaria arbuscula]